MWQNDKMFVNLSTWENEHKKCIYNKYWENINKRCYKTIEDCFKLLWAYTYFTFIQNSRQLQSQIPFEMELWIDITAKMATVWGK